MTANKEHRGVFYLTKSHRNAIITTLMMKTAREVMMELASRAKARRLDHNLTRMGLAERSGVSMSVIRAFETTGKISLESLLKIAIALGDSESFDSVLVANQADSHVSLDQLLRVQKTRKRGRVT